MSRSLPSRPSFHYLQQEAKDIHKAHAAGDASCCETLRLLERFSGQADKDILAAKLKLTEVQHALASGYGFNNWKELKQKVLKAGERSVLHIHCGDSSAGTLRRSSVAGEVLVWHDPVLEGPVPGGVSDQEYREIRARFFVEQQYVKMYDGALRGLTAGHAKLAQAKDHAEVVLWFDACLFDQTIMIHLIDKLARTDTGDTKLSLICIGEHPEFKRFRGLGELSPEQMAALYPRRHAIAASEKKLAAKAWKAFASYNPRAIEEVLAQDCSALPYLAAALRRHLEQYPSAINGLSRLQREALEVVASGTSKLGPIFSQVSDKEDRPFFGETTMWDCLDELAEGSEPLLKVEGPGRLKHPLWEPVQKIGQWSVGITDTGRKVLAGELDYVRLRGIDRWLGGVHLQGTEAQWRWDEDARRLVEQTGSEAGRVRSRTTPVEQATGLLARIIRDAVEKRASDIHFEWVDGRLHLRLRVDGDLQAAGVEVPCQIQDQVIDRAKAMARLDANVRDRPQIGRAMVDVGGKRIDLRISVVPYVSGESVVVRIMDAAKRLLKLADQDWTPDQLTRIRSWIGKPNGIIVMTGPVGCGRTTTLYGILDELNTGKRKIVTSEDPVEYLMRGVSQLQIDVAKGITYARAIREQMRQDPDVMMVSECMDPEVLQLVTQVAVTGHLVLTSLHTNSAPDVLRRVLDMGGEPYLLNRHLVGVLSQRLVRVVCSHCKEKYEPESWVRSALGIGKEIEFFRGVGCGKCHNMGYRGRQAIHELLELNDQLRDAIARNAPAAELTRIAVDSGMRTLKEDGLAKAAQGITTVDEVLRVSG